MDWVQFPRVIKTIWKLTEKERKNALFENFLTTLETQDVLISCVDNMEYVKGCVY